MKQIRHVSIIGRVAPLWSLLRPEGFSMDFSLFSKAPGETIHLKYVEPVRRENGGKGAKITRPRELAQ
jgi:hypothetical protein